MHGFMDCFYLTWCYTGNYPLHKWDVCNDCMKVHPIIIYLSIPLSLDIKVIPKGLLKSLRGERFATGM